MNCGTCLYNYYGFRFELNEGLEKITATVFDQL